MSDTIGLLKTCDRCGEQVFLKCTGVGETDGGFTRWNKFEPPPSGWNYIKDVGTVCPKCWEDYAWVLEQYKKRTPQEKEG